MAAVSLGLAGRAGAEPAAWDPERATSLSEKLVEIARQLEEAAAEAPAQPTAMQQRTRDAALLQLPRIRANAEELHRRLGRGWDRDETVAYFAQLRESVQELWTRARDAKVLSQRAVDLLDEARSVARELGAYYDGA